MSASARPLKRATVEEFFAADDGSPSKHVPSRGEARHRRDGVVTLSVRAAARRLRGLDERPRGDRAAHH
jgi:hypothetical protein